MKILINYVCNCVHVSKDTQLVIEYLILFWNVWKVKTNLLICVHVWEKVTIKVIYMCTLCSIILYSFSNFNHIRTIYGYVQLVVQLINKLPNNKIRRLSLCAYFIFVILYAAKSFCAKFSYYVKLLLQTVLWANPQVDTNCWS